MTSCGEIMETLDSRLWDVWAAGVNPWIAGGKLIAGRMGIEADLAVEGVLAVGGAFTRVVQAEDPRRFRVAVDAQRAAAIPALLLHVETRDDEDLIALSLKEGSGRFWRATCQCDWIGDIGLDGSGTLRLRQDAHAYFGGVLKAKAYGERGRRDRAAALQAGFDRARAASGVERFADAMKLPADHPARAAYLRGFQAALRAGEAAEQRWRISAIPPAGALIFDPAAMDWTRRGVLGEAEWIEILDAPEDGPLGRAIKRLNPRIGTKHGVPLSGLAPERPKYQRRAA